MERFKRDPAPSNLGGGFSSHSRLRTARRDGETPHYTLVREVLLAYLSPILVDSVLERALSSRRLTADSLSHAQLAEVASDVMVGLRLFVADDRLPQLMLDLAEVLGLSE